MTEKQKRSRFPKGERLFLWSSERSWETMPAVTRKGDVCTGHG
ncbi:hypothetical protein HMPREF7215_2804 [Pyramidobacter piscolens W5455]|uniref:Uncharacterized protein n=1 Tax=Pyramidobacter piscolens W5455 TaxID=352165 RepID=A0ABM9ZXA6_9BACT|nr:hypothetical protein HMPREF7215_2804 [Pyramidobacter piscolens W5455]